MAAKELPASVVRAIIKKRKEQSLVANVQRMLEGMKR